MTGTSRRALNPSHDAFLKKKTALHPTKKRPAWALPAAGAILDRFLHHAQTIAITGRGSRLKDHSTVAGKEDKNKKIKSKPNETSTTEPAS